jgi:DAACS family dicarboxylate/amino acid:cation (Na+ or H+) symporter/aerobic C4-dicarboxylate transport protein
MRKLLSTLYFQVLLGIVIGGLIGYFSPHLGTSLKPLGDGFIKLIKMLLGPIVFLTVVLGVARMGDVKRVGRVGLKAIIYFEIVSSLALIIGLVVGAGFHPGSTMHVDPATLDMKSVQSYASAAKQQHGVTDFLLNIIPSSAVDAFARGDMLQIILFSVLLGVALSHLGTRVPTLLKLLDDVLQGMFGIVRIVMRVAPLGAGGAIAFTIGSYGIGTMASYGRLIACLYLTTILFVFVVLGSIAAICRISFWKYLRYIKEEILVTFGTASTEAVLPKMMAKLEHLGCERTVVGMVLPAGYTFNADGTSIYLTMATLFVAQATGTHLSLMDTLVILAVALFTSKGIAGVAGGGFVALAATLSSMNKIPVAALVLLLGIDRFLNEARAVANLIGNGIATVAVAKWEGQFDQHRAEAVLNQRIESTEALEEKETAASHTPSGDRVIG